MADGEGDITKYIAGDLLGARKCGSFNNGVLVGGWWGCGLSLIEGLIIN